MAPPSRKKPKPPKIIFPRDYNIAVRGALYRVYARPLVPARAAGHPFRNKTVFDITNLVESISWSSSNEEGGAVTGSVTLRNPGNFLGVLVAGSKIIVKQASPFIANVDIDSLRKRRYVTILEMIVQEREKQQVEQLMSLTLGDRLTYLNQGKLDFKYVKKKGKRSPTASSIIRAEATKQRIPWTKDSIPTTTIAIPKAMGTQTTALSFFAGVLKLHNKLVDKANGKKPAPPNWDINMRTGVLTIRPKKPPTRVWYINEGNFVGEPSYRESTKGFATRVVATAKNTTYKEKKNQDGSISKRKKGIKKKLKITVTNEAMAAVYGLITHTEKVAGNVTPEKLRRVANSVLAKKCRMTRELSFTCPALPNIWPGSKVFLNMPTYGMKGLFAVKAIEYSITGTEGPMMSLTVDAGSVSIVSEAAPVITKVARTKLHNDGRTVTVYYKGADPVTYKHPKSWRVHKVTIVRAADLPEHERPAKGETVLITYVNKKSRRVPNKVEYPPGLVAVTDEGYIPTAGLA